ncbi:MAG: uroporphyrinogen-III synthase [Novosphingobium sp.]|nr:uroporphyrinogen-III synthase [Novosphingobium sp.]
MPPVIVIRPEPGNARTVAAARGMGMEAHGFPLFTLRPVEWDTSGAASFDALLIGSANAMRHGGPQLAALRLLPAFCVGEATARAAREAGMRVEGVGEGHLQPVIDRIAPRYRRLLRLCGRERVAVTVPPGTVLEERVVYASDPLPMPDGLRAMLARPAVVMLHSAEAGRHFARLVDHAGLPREATALAAIAPRVIGAAGPGWRDVRSAVRPDDKALLALASQMCQTAGSG